jgi:hypothetical protein
MFMLNDKPIALDTAFTVGEGDEAIQYPANWLRLASTEDRAAIGITEVADPEIYDDRFYWGVGNPKDFAMVRDMLHSQLTAIAYSLLSPTDYKLVRKVETGQDVDQETLDKRSAIRSAFTANSALIEAATTTEELAAIQFTWPSDEVA